MKCNLLYLIDNVNDVIKMEHPNIFKIKMYLNNQSQDELFLDRYIPIFTEDEEARILLDLIFNYFEDLDQKNGKQKRFSDIRRFLYFVKASIGAENLVKIFADNYLIASTLRSICVLDGDHKDSANVERHILVLPGEESPEKLIMDYSRKQSKIDSPIWKHSEMINLNYTKVYFLDNIFPEIDGIDKKLEEMKKNGESTKGLKRDLNKKVFNKYKNFFCKMYIFWLNDPDNQAEIKNFYKHFEGVFRKVAPYHGIDHKLWDISK